MTRILAAAALCVALTACGHTPIVSTPAAHCADMVPPSWAEAVEAAPVPEDDTRIASWIGKPLTWEMVSAIIAPWAKAYVQQDGQLAKANGRSVDTVGIVQRCEKMMNAARPGER